MTLNLRVLLFLISSVCFHFQKILPYFLFRHFYSLSLYQYTPSLLVPLREMGSHLSPDEAFPKGSPALMAPPSNLGKIGSIYCRELKDLHRRQGKFQLWERGQSTPQTEHAPVPLTSLA